MMRLVRPSAISGTVWAPPSKSIAQRAIALALLANGHSEVVNAGISKDVEAAISIDRALGAGIIRHGNALSIEGGIKHPANPLCCGESGLAIRMFAAIAATLHKPVTLTGVGTLKGRPMGQVEQAIKTMGAKCSTNGGLLPIVVKGPMLGGHCRMDSSLSSQALTGLLMAAPYAMSDTTISVNNLQSKSYVDITIDVMRSFGVFVDNDDYEVFRVKSGQCYRPTQITIEGDWSGAAFLLVAGAIAGEVEVTNLNPLSLQPDREIVNALIWCGAYVSIRENSILVRREGLNGFHFDATHCPDLFPPLVALASHCKGESRILGVSRLKVKESDRGAALMEEYSKMGIGIAIQDDLMIIRGGKPKAACVQSHDDHRIAMSCAVAALTGEGEVEIDHAEAVGKSYPEFFTDIQRITGA